MISPSYSYIGQVQKVGIWFVKFWVFCQELALSVEACECDLLRRASEIAHTASHA